MDVIRITPEDTRYTIREQLRRIPEQHALLVLPWEVEKGWTLALDYEILYREAAELQQRVAWVVEDPARRALPREAGFAVFVNELLAEDYLSRRGDFPALRAPRLPQAPTRPPWAEELRPPPLPLLRRRPIWLLGIEVLIFLTVLATLGGFAFYTIPQATITLSPQGTSYSRIVVVSVDPTAEEVDLQRNVVPSRRIGDEFEGFAQVATTGRGFSFSGYATGRVTFTNLLGQDYRIPEGTLVRTTSTSYPVRFQTTAEVIVPAFGQAEAAVEALEEGPRGNVDAYQINLVEGVVGFAVRVTNPLPISGAESDAVALVSEEDRARAWELATQQVMAEAYNGLQDPNYLEPGEFLPRQPLVIQAAPKIAYTHVVGEATDVLGLTLRLLVTGQAVSAADVQAVAYRGLLTTVPQGYSLTATRFAFGEAAEEDVGPGVFSFYVTAEGYAAANIDAAELRAQIEGQSVEAARQTLAALPLAEPPQITVTPAWFPFIPRLPMRITLNITPQGW